MAGETKEACLCDHESIVCGRLFGAGKDRNVCCQRHLEGQSGEWTSNRKRENLGGDAAKEKKGPGIAFGGGERNRPHAGWGGVDKPKNGNGGHGQAA